MISRTRVLISAAFAAMASPAFAVVGFADTVIDFFDSGAGPIAGPYGGTLAGAFPVPVSTSVVLGPDGSDPDFLSLPTGSYVTVGFTDEIVRDGIGNDIFIQEVGPGGEKANVFVSADLVNYIFLGEAADNGQTAFDLNSILFTGIVRAVRIVGLDEFGGSPGFDVVNVQVLPGAFVPGDPGAVPEPASWAMMMAGFGLVGAGLRRRGRTDRRLATA